MRLREAGREAVADRWIPAARRHRSRNRARSAVTLVRGVPHADPVASIAVSFGGVGERLHHEAPALEERSASIDPPPEETESLLRRRRAVPPASAPARASSASIIPRKRGNRADARSLSRRAGRLAARALRSAAPCRRRATCSQPAARRQSRSQDSRTSSSAAACRRGGFPYEERRSTSWKKLPGRGVHRGRRANRTSRSRLYERASERRVPTSSRSPSTAIRASISHR